MSEIRVEAENMTLTGFRLETNTAASGGQIISLVGGELSEVGSARFTFDGPSGSYNIVVRYFDETDGVSHLEVGKSGLTIDGWYFNQNLGSALANTRTQVRRAIASGLTVKTGDIFRLYATENNGEPARIDYIEFTPVVAPATTSTIINGTNANDRLVGNARNNTLNGFAGNDILDGRGGHNKLNGGSGIDTADYSQATNGIIANFNTGTVLKPVFGTTTPKVMPLGDSITAGQHAVQPTPGTYRIQLWKNLRADNLSVDFVGSQFNGPPSLGDKNHEGHGGWTINQIAGLVDQGSIKTYQPQIVLLMIGTNDVLRGHSLNTITGDLSNLIDRISQDSSNTRIFVSSIAPIDPAIRGTTRANLAKSFNALLSDFVSEKVAQGKKVTYVNAGGSLDLTELVPDGVHPNVSGYNKIGNAWYDTLVKRDTLTGIENVIGSRFADKLIGNSEHNTLKGGLGSDTLTGGGGADNFFYKAPNEGGDIITDFGFDDRFTFSADGFGGGLVRGIKLSTIAADTGVFVNGANPTPLGSSANFLYNTNTGVLRFDRDGVGVESSAVTIATLLGTPSLSASQFYIS
ncbi:GDSL-type esterase/lipase family protein [Chroogloeocystis siderophila]|nr:GDSL-type esterase/lipase family protein [Chroogloeocystis siderophila]